MAEESDGIPVNFIRGSATGNGDCFFDAVAQALNQILTESSKATAKSLRQLCGVISVTVENEEKEWLENALKLEDGYEINEYGFRICYTARDLEKMPIIASRLNLPTPIWGRAEIEGRIICKHYNIKLHLIEKQNVCGDVIWMNQLVSQNGSKSVDEVNWKDKELIHILNEGNFHFIPILPLNYEYQFTPAYKKPNITKHLKHEKAFKRQSDSVIHNFTAKTFKSMDITNGYSINRYLKMYHLPIRPVFVFLALIIFTFIFLV
ncbi:hypothetical protein CHUAL_004226 [Chamberlinius hualienensis]